jgi:hypothetical protein
LTETNVDVLTIVKTKGWDGRDGPKKGLHSLTTSVQTRHTFEKAMHETAIGERDCRGPATTTAAVAGGGAIDAGRRRPRIGRKKHCLPCEGYNVHERVNLIDRVVREPSFHQTQPLVEKNVDTRGRSTLGEGRGAANLEYGGSGHVVNGLLFRSCLPCRHHNPEAMDLIDDEKGKLFVGDRVPGSDKGRKLETSTQGIEGAKEEGSLTTSRAEKIEDEPLEGSDKALSFGDGGPPSGWKPRLVGGTLAKAEE